MKSNSAFWVPTKCWHRDLWKPQCQCLIHCGSCLNFWGHLKPQLFSCDLEVALWSPQPNSRGFKDMEHVPGTGDLIWHSWAALSHVTWCWRVQLLQSEKSEFETWLCQCLASSLTSLTLNSAYIECYGD